MQFLLTLPAATSMKFFAKLLSSVRNRKGQSIVEIALVTPLLLVALYIPADFGIAYLVANILNTAVRDGAIIASTSGKSGPSSGGLEDNRNFAAADAEIVINAVVARLPAYITGRSVTVTFYEDDPANCFEFVEVRATGQYSFFFYRILRLLGGAVANPVRLSRTAQMPYRNQPFGNGTKCTGTGSSPFTFYNV